MPALAARQVGFRDGWARRSADRCPHQDDVRRQSIRQITSSRHNLPA